MTLKYKNGEIRKYSQEILSLANKVYGIPEELLIFWYSEGLSGDARWLLKEKNPSQLTDAIRLVTAFEETRSPKASSSAKEHGFTVIPSEAKVKVANNQLSNIEGMTEPLLIDFQGHSVELTLVIMDHDEEDILLGVDWFMKTGAGLFPARKILEFPKQKLPLDHFDNEEVDRILLSEIIDIESDELDGPIISPAEEEFKLTPVQELTSPQLIEFNRAMKYWLKLCAYDVKNLKPCNVGKHVIRVKNIIYPIYSPPYRKSIKERQAITKEIDSLLEAGIIEKSISPWSSPVILVTKKDGTNRFVVEYRKLNAVTESENWPLPRIEDILDRLSGSVWFSAIDLTSGYWQIEVVQRSTRLSQHLMVIISLTACPLV